LLALTSEEKLQIDPATGSIINSQPLKSGFSAVFSISSDQRYILGIQNIDYALYDLHDEVVRPLVRRMNSRSRPASPFSADSQWIMVVGNCAGEVSAPMLLNLGSAGCQFVGNLNERYVDIRFLKDNKRILGITPNGRLHLIDLSEMMQRFSLDSGADE
jgi:hypothetical protein